MPHTTPRALSLLLAALVLALPGRGHGQTPTPPAPASVAAPVHAARPERLQASFASPGEAVTALVSALRAGDVERSKIVLGPGAGKVIQSGDPVEDSRARAEFLAAYDRQQRVETIGDDRAVLHIGERDWPLPFPIIRDQGGWRFDTKAGLQEVLDRRVGENELSAIQVCLAFVDAEREYVLEDHKREGLLEYAQRIISSEGKHDGLYWPSTEGKRPSPMGAAFARANKDALRGSDDSPQPYHGYYFRILTAQGPNARGGAFDYLVQGKMIGGFALVAYPARHGASGIVTLIVNQDGVVFSKDLGKDPSAPQRVTRFDPDETWKQEPTPTPQAAAP